MKLRISCRFIAALLVVIAEWDAGGVQSVAQSERGRVGQVILCEDEWYDAGAVKSCLTVVMTLICRSSIFPLWSVQSLPFTIWSTTSSHWRMRRTNLQTMRPAKKRTKKYLLKWIVVQWSPDEPVMCRTKTPKNLRKRRTRWSEKEVCDCRAELPSGRQRKGEEHFVEVERITPSDHFLANFLLSHNFLTEPSSLIFFVGILHLAPISTKSLLHGCHNCYVSWLLLYLDQISDSWGHEADNGDAQTSQQATDKWMSYSTRQIQLTSKVCRVSFSGTGRHNLLEWEGLTVRNSCIVDWQQ